MKKVITILSLLFISVFILTGCGDTKCIDKKEEPVKVKIVNEYYEPNRIFMGIISYTAYGITVDYNGIEYSFNTEDVYRKYHGRIGETVSAVLTTETYDNGQVRQYIDHLGGM